MSITATQYSVHRASLTDEAAVAAYESLLEKVPNASPFLSIPAARAAANAYDLGASIWLVFDEDETPVTALIAYEKKRGPFTALALPPLVPVSAPVLAAPLRESDIHARRTPLDALLSALPYDQETLALDPAWHDVRPFQWAGWTLTPNFTYWIELDADPLITWRPQPRKTLRRHANSYTYLEDPAALEDAIRLMRESYERNDGTLITAPGRIKRHAEGMIAIGLARCFVVVNDESGAIEGAQMIVRNNRFAHAWFAGSRPGPAMTVLYGYLVPALARTEIKFLDLTGANVASIAEFKRQFGGTLVHGYRARRVSNPFLRAIEGLRAVGGTRV